MYSDIIAKYEKLTAEGKNEFNLFLDNLIEHQVQERAALIDEAVNLIKRMSDEQIKKVFEELQAAGA